MLCPTGSINDLCIFITSCTHYGKAIKIEIEILNIESHKVEISTENHILVFTNAGFTKPRAYRYWNSKTRAIDFDGMIDDLKSAPENSVIILNACAHNPTGMDPTPEQWEKIADVMEVNIILYT